MFKFFKERIGKAFAILLGLVFLIYFMFLALPNPDDVLMGQRGNDEVRMAIIKDLGMDKSKPMQLALLVNDLSPLSFYNSTSTKLSDISGFGLFTIAGVKLVIKLPYLRKSFLSRNYVSHILWEGFKGTLVLALAALLISMIIGIPIGVLASIKRGTWIDSTIIGASTLGISVPSFFSAMIFSWLFGYVLKVYTGLNMVGHLYEVDPMGNGYVLNLKNLILPALALGIRPLAVFIQLTRNTMVDILDLDYVRTAKAKGLSFRKVVWKHAFPNAINPLVTSVGGWLSSLLAGAFFTEYIFNWKGLGKIGIEALQQSDLPVIMGTVLFTAGVFFIINLFTEYIYIRLDPKIRYE